MHLCIHRQLYQYIEGRKPGNLIEAILVWYFFCMYPDRMPDL